MLEPQIFKTLEEMAEALENDETISADFVSEQYGHINIEIYRLSAKKYDYDLWDEETGEMVECGKISETADDAAFKAIHYAPIESWYSR